MAASAAAASRGVDSRRSRFVINPQVLGRSWAGKWPICRRPAPAEVTNSGIRAEPDRRGRTLPLCYRGVDAIRHSSWRPSDGGRNTELSCSYNFSPAPLRSALASRPAAKAEGPPPFPSKAAVGPRPRPGRTRKPGARHPFPPRAPPASCSAGAPVPPRAPPERAHGCAAGWLGRGPDGSGTPAWRAPSLFAAGGTPRRWGMRQAIRDSAPNASRATGEFTDA
jgi:hypothetical protein